MTMSDFHPWVTLYTSDVMEYLGWGSLLLNAPFIISLVIIGCSPTGWPSM